VKAKLDGMRGIWPEERIASTTAGTPEQVAEIAQAYVDVGIEGLTFSMPYVHDLDEIALVGDTLAPFFNPEHAAATA